MLPHDLMCRLIGLGQCSTLECATLNNIYLILLDMIAELSWHAWIWQPDWIIGMNKKENKPNYYKISIETRHKSHNALDK